MNWFGLSRFSDQFDTETSIWWFTWRTLRAMSGRARPNTLAGQSLTANLCWHRVSAGWLWKSYKVIHTLNRHHRVSSNGHRTLSTSIANCIIESALWTLDVSALRLSRVFYWSVLDWNTSRAFACKPRRRSWPQNFCDHKCAIFRTKFNFE